MKRPLCVLITLLSLGLSLSADRAGAYDAYPDWQDGAPVARVASVRSAAAPSDAPQDCAYQAVMVDGESGHACVTVMKGWRYALWLHAGTNELVVGVGSDSQMYFVNGMPGMEPMSNPGSGTLVYHVRGGGFTVYRDFKDSLVRGAHEYTVMDGAGAQPAYYDGELVSAGSASLSHGGDWLVAEIGVGVARVNLATLETRIVSPVTAGYDEGYTPLMDLAVSDDGQTVFIGGRLYEHRQLWAVRVSDGCGTHDYASPNPGKGCAARDLTGLFDDGALPDGWPVAMRAGTHGRRLDLYLERFDGGASRAAVYPSGDAPARLAYLALGDSFSSGEGDPGKDLAGVPYYEPMTNGPASGGLAGDRCHLSRRSYPFKVAAFGALPGEGVQSVACNNAHIGDVASDDPNGYQGQDGRLGGLSTAYLSDLRQAAITGFVPGRLRQSDFVDQYQPDVITLGIGGNDVQFAQVISDCARSVTTCSYATDPTDRRNLGESIGALYPKLVALYGDLSRRDRGAKLYVVGYPRFVNETAESCPATTNLDKTERQMVDQGVRYIDAVIKAAAETAGVRYIDVEDTLLGHRLCDADEYVNGIDFADTHAQEQFHPDADAHSLAAAAIERQTGGRLADDAYCPDGAYPCPSPTDPPPLPAFFGDAAAKPERIAVPAELVVITDPALPYVVDGTLPIVIKVAGLAAGTAARIELHSDAVALGSVTVGADGAASASLMLPGSVAPGYHTLHLYGTSPAGEAVDMYQIIDVERAVPRDAAGQAEPTADPVAASKAATDMPGSSKAPHPEEAATTTAVSPPLAVLPFTAGLAWPLLWPSLLVADGGLLGLCGRALARRGWRLRHG